MKSCGYANTKKFQLDLKRYRSTSYDENGNLVDLYNESNPD